MIVVTFLNQKGGVGKTSTTFHLAGTFSLAGRRVLLVDNDPQASLTQGFFGPSAAESVPAAASVAALYDPFDTPPASSVVVPTGLAGVDLVPGSIALTDHNVPDRARWPDRQDGLRAFLAGVAGSYDLALVDCAPNLHLCSWAALLASDAVVVPLQAEDFGSQGLAPVGRAVASARAAANPSLRVAGYLLTMFDKRLAVHLAYQDLLRARYGAAVFGAVVPRAKDYVEAVAARRPVALATPRSAAARAMAAVAAELETRAGVTGQGRGAA